MGEIDPCFLDRSSLPSGFFELYFKLNGEFTWAVTVTSCVVNSWVGETASAWACSIAIYPLCDHFVDDDQPGRLACRRETRERATHGRDVSAVEPEPNTTPDVVPQEPEPTPV